MKFQYNKKYNLGAKYVEKKLFGIERFFFYILRTITFAVKTSNFNKMI